MKTDVKFDFDKVPENSSYTVRAMLQVHAEKPEGETRRPLNIGVVLDRSGSMGGEKIHSVREATKTLARKLGGDDTFSLTIFDNVIDTVIWPSKMDRGLGDIEAAIDGIEARNMTNLCGGYQKGCEHVLNVQNDNSADRVFLLTDGLANEGITNTGEIARITGDMAERGITTSTVGVGSQYNEELLGRMAEAGGGNTYFLRTASESEEVFEDELGSLFSLAAQNLRVRFTPADDGVGAEQLNTYRVTDGSWVLGDVYGGQTKLLLLELEVPSAPAGEEIKLGSLSVTCERTVEGGFEEYTEDVPLVVHAVTQKEFSLINPNMEVTVEAVNLTVAAARARARDLADQRFFDEASAALISCAAALEGLGLDHPRIREHIQNLREQGERMRFDREAYFTARQKKQYYMESELMMKGKPDKLQAMLSRQARYDDDDGMSGRGRRRNYGPGGGREVFPFYSTGGHFFTEIDGRRYLVDTGFKVSVGGGQLQIAGRPFDLVRLSGAADVREISRVIGARITGVIGADILNSFDVIMDTDAGTLSFHQEDVDMQGRVIRADFAWGVPIIRADVNGSSIPVVISTGSRISFVPTDLVNGSEVVGTEFESVPGFGEFETEVHKLSIAIDGRDYRITAGTLPAPLQQLLSTLGVEGVLGGKFFNTRRLHLSARRGIVTIEKKVERDKIASV